MKNNWRYKLTCRLLVWYWLIAFPAMLWCHSGFIQPLSIHPGGVLPLPFHDFNQIIILHCLGGNYGDTAARHWIPVILVFFFYISELWRQGPCCFNTCTCIDLCWGFTAAALPDRPHLKLRHLHSRRGTRGGWRATPVGAVKHTHRANIRKHTLLRWDSCDESPAKWEKENNCVFRYFQHRRTQTEIS